jgi:hypothetical protein
MKGFKGASKEVRLANSKKLLMKKFSSYLEGEEVYDTYTCSLIGKILLSGKMYVTSKRVLHRSYFNDKTLFGKGSRVSIMLNDIVHIEKRCYNNMKIFPNTIFIKAKAEKGEIKEYTFTSYVYSSRDECFDKISRIAADSLALNRMDPNLIASTVIVTSSDSESNNTE